MFEKLSEKDKKTLKNGAIAVVAIAVLMLTMQGYGSWNQNQGEYDKLMKDLNKVNLTDSMRSRQLNAVPEFQMPRPKQDQKEAFRNELDALLDSLRIDTEPWQEVTVKKSPLTDYGFLLLKCSGSCRFEQILDLLAGLKSNPYLAGIEELSIQCDPQNPQQADFAITVSTFTNNKRG